MTMTFADPRELRRRKIELLRSELAHASTDEERARIEAELRELTRFRLRRYLWPSGPHGS
jgi:hypothetical protein